MKQEDKNYVAYQNSLRSDEWFERYKGQFVVFVDGQFVDNDYNKNEILERVRDKYKDIPRFFTKVTREKEIVCLPISLEMVLEGQK